ncbi:hypothetical protein MKK55_12960 [Methylobacterium sp. J-059]|uniref:hypothetical protein n=1 Tax=Methylobacterium sp. J-059 TaxID=2836643 RepID=UPI001FBA5826|nr:hypothetical protein [Methylobacterium sp. J-059]MCJ2039842.1 hypothetical protein [Methylobacterium sp. J-059]
MILAPTITDHALLRYMRRIYRVDTSAWRKAMLSDVGAALAAYQGHHAPGQAAFVISSTGRVVDVLDENAKHTIAPGRPDIIVPRIII